MYRGITSNLVVTWSMYSARIRENGIDQESPQPPGAAPGGEQWAAEPASLTCVYSRSPLLALPPELRFLSDQWGIRVS